MAIRNQHRCSPSGLDLPKQARAMQNRAELIGFDANKIRPANDSAQWLSGAGPFGYGSLEMVDKAHFGSCAMVGKTPRPGVRHRSPPSPAADRPGDSAGDDQRQDPEQDEVHPPD